MKKPIMKIVLSCFVLLSLISCSKKVIEIRPVIMLEQDISIPTVNDINYFSFPSEDVGYAASVESWVIYKTLDGGSSWEELEVSSPVKKCNGLEFFSNDSGMCLMNTTIYITNNGGETWTANGTADFIGKTDDNIGVKGDCGSYSCEISTSTNNGESFTLKGSASMDGDFISARIVDGKAFIFSDEVFYYDRLHGLDLETGETVEILFENVISNERPTDIYIDEGFGAATGHSGLIADPTYGERYYRNHYGNAYSFYSVDGVGDLIVAVGEKTIVTNMSIAGPDTWNYMTDVDGNGFIETFYKIRFIDERRLYISGSEGTLLKIKI
jgi:hypothetical protein